MGQKVVFNGKIYTEPVSVANIVSGVRDLGSPASFAWMNLVITEFL